MAGSEPRGPRTREVPISLVHLDERLLKTCPQSPNGPVDVTEGVRRPLVLRVSDDGSLLLVDGTRRIEAARSERMESIPAICFSGLSDEDASRLRALANALDRDLAMSEKAALFRQLLPLMRELDVQWKAGIASGRKGRWPNDLLSHVMGVSKAQASYELDSAMDLVPEAIEAVDAGLVSPRGARLLSKHLPADQLAYLEELRRAGVRDSRGAYARLLEFKTACGHVKAAVEHLSAAERMEGGERPSAVDAARAAEIAARILSALSKGPSRTGS